MSFWTEHFGNTEENFHLQVDFIHELKNQTGGIRELRVLDFGSGPVPYTSSAFSRLQKDQEIVVAYDPTVANPPSNSENTFGAEIHWTDREPAGEKFHLIVCNFSLHHLSGDLSSIIKGLTVYSPQIIGIADYDYTGKALEDFEKTFVSQQETKELNSLFNGDWQACFDYHRRLGMDDFKKGLRKSGFDPVVSKKGDKIAESKFFLIGRRVQFYAQFSSLLKNGNYIT
jgi:hypothetical protein